MAYLLRTLRGQMSFFNRQISQKYGKPCCRYNQDGKPMPEERAKQVYGELNDFLKGWKLREEGRRLIRHYYLEDYPLALEFLKEVVRIDANEFKQCPTYKVEYGQLLTLQLYSLTLKGLSMMDFQFAMRINNINPHAFSLLHIENQKEYRFEASLIRMEREAQRVSKELDEDMKKWKK